MSNDTFGDDDSEEEEENSVNTVVVEIPGKTISVVYGKTQ